MIASIRKFMEADVKCYHCGHVSGALRVDHGVPNAVPLFKPAGETLETPVQRGGVIRCSRCNGSTFYDEFDVREEIVRIERLDEPVERRGRPRKQAAAERGAA